MKPRSRLEVVFFVVVLALPGAARAGEVGFAPQSVISATAVGLQPVCSADVDGDGDPDVLSAGGGAEQVQWHENTAGDGSAWVTHGIRPSPGSVGWSVVAADVDGDGDLDALSSSPVDVAWYENLAGDGSTWTTRLIDTSTGHHHAVRAADLDGDGDTDVVATSMNEVAWYENTAGDGSVWSRSVLFLAPEFQGHFHGAAVADMDGDGDADLLSVSLEGYVVYWHENTTGDGSVWTAHELGYGGSRFVTAADVDGDGDLDAVASGPLLIWYENTLGDGSAWSPHVVDVSDSSQIYSVFVVDVDADGDRDILFNDQYVDTVGWVENTLGDGSVWIEHELATIDGPYSVTGGDLDRDGDLDVVTGSSTDGEVVWLENETIHRSAAYPAPSTISTNLNVAYEVWTGDVDGDGDLDALSASGQDDKVAWHENLVGDGAAWTEHVISTSIDVAWAIHAGDLDGDGDLDALSGADGVSGITWHENTAGDGSSWADHVISANAGGTRSVLATDVDGDGDLDALCSAWRFDKIAWYENTAGDGSAWTEHAVSTTIDEPLAVFAADVDGDGDVDVLSGAGGANTIAWHENLAGDGSAWAEHVISAGAGLGFSVFAADLDRDGDLDVLSASDTIHTVAWHENTAGDGSVWAEHAIETELIAPRSVFASDLDGDGDLDVVSAFSNQPGESVAWFENTNGDGTDWTTHRTVTPLLVCWSAVAADIDRDADPDILSTVWLTGGEDLVWHENRGGQFGLATTSTAPPAMLAGQADDLLEFEVRHNGRAGDTDVELASVELLFEEAAGDPLTTAQAGAMIDRLDLYHDDGSGVFESGADTLVATLDTLSLADGVQEMPLPDGDPSCRVAHGAPEDFFVVVTMTPEAGESKPRSLSVTHLTESTSTAEDRDRDIPLSLEFAWNVSTGLIEVPEAAGVPFAAEAEVSATPGAWFVLTGDVDRDGDTDVLSSSTAEIAWHENAAGDGSTWIQHVIATDTGPALFAADVDGDGDLDVLSAPQTGGTMTWQENTVGDGSAWVAHVITTVAAENYAISAADVDRDGDLDVLAAIRGGTKVAWYENTAGDGSTWAEHTIDTETPGGYALSTADMDRDGDLDVLLATEWGAESKILWYENAAGDGSAWTEHAVLLDVAAQLAVFAADVDADGDLDLIGANHVSHTVTWYENMAGDGTAWTEHTVTTSAEGAASVFAADLDHDGDLDVCSASYADDKVAWYENVAGDGTVWREWVLSTTVDVAVSVRVEDLDGDGDPDVLSTSNGDGKVVWFANETIHRSAEFPIQSGISTGADGAYSVVAADMDRDGDLDALSASYNDHEVTWYENVSVDGSSWTEHAISTGTFGARSVFVADVDRDGDPDALSASYADSTIAWHENSAGDGSAWTMHVITGFANGAFSVFAADVDGDGDPDALSASINDDTIAWHENTAGDGSAWTSHVITAAADGAISVHAADVDRDGDLDAISASVIGDTVAWHENTAGDGSVWVSHTVAAAAGSPGSVFATDVDRDGDLDVVSASSTDARVTWHENTAGDGSTWSAHAISSEAGQAAGSVFVLDLDRDGDPDVVTTSYTGDAVVWHENTSGDGSAWTAHSLAGAADGAWSVFAADVDRDGDFDVLSASDLDDKVAWYPNGGGQFRLETTDTAPATMLEGEQVDLLRVEITHNGRTGDTDLEMATLELLFEETAGDPLTTVEAAELIARLEVYLDDGSGVFEPGLDTWITTVPSLDLDRGLQTVVFDDGDPRCRVALGASGTHFVVVELTLDAGEQPLRTFRVTHVTESSSRAEDRAHDSPLDLESVPNLSSKLIDVPLVIPMAAGAVPDGHHIPGTQLQMAKGAGGTLVFSWGTPCGTEEGDYAVYEGTRGDFSSHHGLTCSTGGATSTTIVPGSGSHYYLVVPVSTNREGSYGTDGNGAERGQGASACHAQYYGGCPPW